MADLVTHTDDVFSCDLGEFSLLEVVKAGDMVHLYFGGEQGFRLNPNGESTLELITAPIEHCEGSVSFASGTTNTVEHATFKVVFSDKVTSDDAAAQVGAALEKHDFFANGATKETYVIAKAPPPRNEQLYETSDLIDSGNS